MQPRRVPASGVATELRGRRPMGPISEPSAGCTAFAQRALVVDSGNPKPSFGVLPLPMACGTRAGRDSAGFRAPGLERARSRAHVLSEYQNPDIKVVVIMDTWPPGSMVRANEANPRGGYTSGNLRKV